MRAVGFARNTSCKMRKDMQKKVAGTFYLWEKVEQRKQIWG
jgi:hypothetical protein